MFFKFDGQNLQFLNNKRSKVILMSDIKTDLNSNSSLKSGYIHMIESNAFSSLINKPTRVATGYETIIDHLTDDTESVITSGVFQWKISTTTPCTVQFSTPISKIQTNVTICLLFVVFIPSMALTFAMTLSLSLCY